jgi:hypothetical protein
MKVDYDHRQYAVYVQGRALPPHTISTWMGVFAQYAGHDRPLDVVDLGSAPDVSARRWPIPSAARFSASNPPSGCVRSPNGRPVIPACATRWEPRLASRSPTTVVTWW